MANLSGFNFKEVNKEEKNQEILKLDGYKVKMYGDIAAEIVKLRVNIHLDSLTAITDKSLQDGEFPSILQVVEMFPVYQKKLQACQCLFTMSKYSIE